MNKENIEFIKRNLIVDVYPTGMDSFAVRLIFCGQVISESGCQIVNPFNPH